MEKINLKDDHDVQFLNWPKIDQMGVSHVVLSRDNFLNVVYSDGRKSETAKVSDEEFAAFKTIFDAIKFVQDRNRK